MIGQVKAFLAELYRSSDEAGGCEIRSWGRDRRFVVRTLGDDTFVFEDGIWLDAVNKDPLTVVSKQALNGEPGHVLTCSHGNHAVTLVPLLSNQFPGITGIDTSQRNAIMSLRVVCANVVKNTIELSQRDTGTAELVDADSWLQRLGLALDGVVLADRVDETLEHYRCLGQEWRVKPLAWTLAEMLHALKDSRARIHTGCSYFHSVKGVHFLSHAEFAAAERLGRDDFGGFAEGLREWIGASGDEEPLMLHEKFHGHHEVELFGLAPGVAEEQLVPRLQVLLRGLDEKAVSPEDAVADFAELGELFRRSLIDPSVEDESSEAFVECMYKHLTGVVYQGAGREITLSFDDRKTAVPGATYFEGERTTHPGADARTLALLEYVESRLSHGEEILSANVYELRSKETARLGEGRTREIVYVTNLHPVPLRLVEKRLAHASSGYGEYTLTRVQAFQSLGMSFGDNHLLERLDRKSGNVHYYVRQRYPGEPSNAIPRRYFQSVDGHSGKDVEAVLRVAALLGEAAAQNAILKKYIPESVSNRFGVGKEIIEFDYDVMRGRELPMRVWLCSVRGTLGWPSTDRTEENLRAVAEYYAGAFAGVVVDFWREHEQTVTLVKVENAFVSGFASRTREAFWNYNSQRELFDAFDPPLQSVYAFREKWTFGLWALVQQHRRLGEFRNMLARRIRREAVRRVNSDAADATDDVLEG